MRKRILSLLLCLIMVVGMLPVGHAHADWEEGAECALCGEYIWGDWVCDCGYGWHCSENSDHYDCYEEYHCGECGEFYEDYLYCEICDRCVDCIGEDNYCFDCYQCKKHHDDDGCDSEGSHTHKVKDEWMADGKTTGRNAASARNP